FFRLRDDASILMSYGMYQEADEARLQGKINMITRLFLQADTPHKFRVNISEAQKDMICDMASKGSVERSIFHSAVLTVLPLLMYFWKKFCRKKAVDLFFRYRQELKRMLAKQLDVTRPEGCWQSSRIQGIEEYPIIRFTLSRGIELILPHKLLIPKDNDRKTTTTQTSLISGKKQQSFICVTDPP
ncbi:hypothetical protein NDU88_003881, partial [Pleurodeles waltl]